MLLAIDVGNTNIVFALFEGEEIIVEWRFETSAAGDHNALVTAITENTADKTIAAAILSSVVPSLNGSVADAVSEAVNVSPEVIGKGGVTPRAKIAIDKPSDVGHDRLVNTDAAFALYGGPLIVVDFGTATTFDIVGPDGAYEGGVIAPGIKLSLKALSDAAAKLPEMTVAPPASGRVTGRNTRDAMRSGIYWGYVGLIEGLVSRIVGEDGRPMKVVATGGLAPLFAEATACIDEIDPDLTLRGLLAVYRANEKSAK